MANIASQIKRNRQNEKRRLRNRDARGSARTAVKDAVAAISTGNESKAAVSAAIVALDRAARKGAIHPRNAARRKSRLLKRLQAAPAAPVSAPAAALESSTSIKPAKNATPPAAAKKAARKAPATKAAKK